MAIKEPRRAAIGLLYEMDGHLEQKNLSTLRSFSSKELFLIKTILDKKINSPLTSSAGRLFDAVASLIELRQINRYEGQAAMELEFKLDNENTDDCYDFELNSYKNLGNSLFHLVNWEIMIGQVLSDRDNDISAGIISKKFHNTLSEIIIAIAKKVQEPKVVLSGGCFQNRYLVEHTVQRLQEEQFLPYWHQRIPPNDGGIAVGQIATII